MQPETAATGVSKSEFARRRNVSPGRVTQWITEGKIFGRALIGSGRSATINEPLAIEQLRKTLDIDQRCGNGLGTRLELPLTDESALTTAPSAPKAERSTPSAPSLDPVEEQIKRARLEGIARDNRKKAEEEAARAGRYVLADEVEQRMAQIAAQMLSMFEGALPIMANAIAAQFSAPQRDALHTLRTTLRDYREKESAKLKAAAAAVPPFVEDEPGEPAPPDDGAE